MLFNSLQTQNYLWCRTIVIFWETRAFLIVRIYGYCEFNVKLHLVMMVVHFYWDTIILIGWIYIESFDTFIVMTNAVTHFNVFSRLTTKFASNNLDVINLTKNYNKYKINNRFWCDLNCIVILST